MKRIIITTASLLAVAIVAGQTPTQTPPSAWKPQKQISDQFFVFTERGSRENHYIASGWMGDFGDIKFNGGFKANAAKGETSMQIKYTAERKQGAGWSGIYWQMPANNWGDKRGGYDLGNYHKLTFMARGEKGGEYIDKFMVGGITGQTEEGDSDEASTDATELSKDWKKYEIDLTGRDLSHMIGGFGFAINAEMNPTGATFYLDEVVFEKK